ncbi:hypothetical protein PRIPAC_70184 [Pristionchus pacificus]|uniref:Uncharacterized protein n=1 Tax=Pristionchus pacificus TaxID=54126 RepID=A0A2A6C783_PRIPA|nr:hypothetical protein PRIPAC_70184 [Pristionchus pacificus]|eukprot:PDM74055.1 hypothetical protein PRIPAC_41411 [Pristionchus pacificus]
MPTLEMIMFREHNEQESAVSSSEETKSAGANAPLPLLKWESDGLNQRSRIHPLYRGCTSLVSICIGDSETNNNRFEEQYADEKEY